MPFAKGQSGNPAGRPVGSRNRFTQEMDEAFEQQGLELIDKLVSLAHDGNTVALRLCADRLVPARKHRHYQIQLPSPDQPDYSRAALAEIQRALSEGEIPTDEAIRLLSYVERATRILASQAVAEIDLAARLERVEEAVARLLILAGAAPMPDMKAKGASAPQPSEAVEDDAAIVNNNAETMAEAAPDSPPIAPATVEAAAPATAGAIENNNGNTMDGVPAPEAAVRAASADAHDADDSLMSATGAAQAGERAPALPAGTA